jgi:uncharacterized protein (TIGR02284 family)
MMTGVPNNTQPMKPETLEPFQELVQALHDNVTFHIEAADRIEDDHVEQILLEIATERKEIQDTIGAFVALAETNPIETTTLLGSFRELWATCRVHLSSGDARVILNEAERAERAIVRKFKAILPKFAGNPVSGTLLKYYDVVKSGHNRVLDLGNIYQNT